MKNSQPLALYEEILLLDLDDDKGTALTGLHRNAMAGAILAELVMLAAIKLSDDKRKLVTAIPRAKVSDPVLNEALQLIAAAKRPMPASRWVMKIATMKDLYHRVAQQLVDKGVLAEKTDTVLVLFKRRVYPEVDGGPERALIRRIEKAIFSSLRQVDERTAVIIALSNATRSLYRVFGRKRLKSRKDRIEQITSGQLVGQATQEAVAAIQAAILVAATTPVIASGR